MPRNPAASTDRDQVILNRLSKIQHKIDSLEQTTAFSLRADSNKHLGEVKKIFGRSVRRAGVYLAADGDRGVQEIASHLGIHQPNVSAEVRKLVDEGLLEIIDGTNNNTTYAKTPLYRTLRIPQFLTKEFDVEKDGRLASRRKSKTRGRSKGRKKR